MFVCFKLVISLKRVTFPILCHETVNSPDNFCYFCGEVTFSTQKCPVTPMVKKAYRSYFICKVGDKDKGWAPHVCCISCATILSKWLNNKGCSMQPFYRLLFLYSSATLAQNYKEKKRAINYSNILSDIRPVPHTEDLPVPVPLQQYILDSDDKPTKNREKTPQPSTSMDADFTADLQFNEFHRITQEELNDLIRDLNLPKSKAELLGSRLQQWKLLKENVRISVYRKRHKDLVQFFKIERGLVACTDIDGLM